MGYNDDRQRERREEEIRRMVHNEREEIRRKKEQAEEQERRNASQIGQQSRSAASLPETPVFKPYNWRRGAIFMVLFAIIGAIVATKLGTQLSNGIIVGGLIGLAYRWVFGLLAGIGLLVAGISVAFMILAFPVCTLTNICGLGPTLTFWLPFLVIGLVAMFLGRLPIKSEFLDD